MEIEFQGFYTWRDLLRAVSLANRPTMRKRLIRVGFAGMVVVIYLLYILFAANGNYAALLEKANIVLHLATLILVTIFLTYPAIAGGLTAYKLWKDPSMRFKYSGSLSDKGIFYTGNKSVIAWNRYAKKVFKSDLIVLLTSKGVLSFFPRSFFQSDADWQRAIQLVNNKVLN